MRPVDWVPLENRVNVMEITRETRDPLWGVSGHGPSPTPRPNPRGTETGGGGRLGLEPVHRLPQVVQDEVGGDGGGGGRGLRGRGGPIALPSAPGTSIMPCIR